MRCLNCGTNDIEEETTLCPSCGVYIPSLLRDILPARTPLDISSARGRLRAKYVLGSPLGRGGFGITYRGRHELLNDEVALKEFYPPYVTRDTSSGEVLVPAESRSAYELSLERFIEEGRALRGLRHPNVVRVDDLFEQFNTAYLVMELLEGVTLRDSLESHPARRLTEEQVMHILLCLVDALEAAHGRGVYHRDIKPDNIMLVPKDGEERVVLIDFSVKAVTRQYAPPELLAGENAGPESDIFELGMLLYELLTGSRPTSAYDRTTGAVWAPIRLGFPWDSLVASALQLERKARPANVRMWLEAATSEQEAWTKKVAGNQHRTPVIALASHSTAPILASTGGDSSIFVWNLTSLTVQHSIPSRAASLAFHPTDHVLFSGGHDGTINAWYSKRGWQGKVIARPSHARILSLAMDGVGRLLVWADDAGNSGVWDTLTGKPLYSVKPAFHNVAVAVNHDGRTFASGGNDGTVKLWSANGTELHSWRAHKGSVRALGFHKHKAQLITSGEDGQVVCWDVSNGKRLFSLSDSSNSEGAGRVNAIECMSMHRTEPWIAWARSDNLIELWHVDTALKLGQGKASAQVSSLIFAGDRLLIEGGARGTITMWRIN